MFDFNSLNTKYDIVSKRKIWYIIALVIIIPCLLSLAFRGLNLGIDFTGGNLFEVKFAQAITEDEIRDVLSEYDQEKATIQLSEEDIALVRTAVLTEDELNEIMDGLRDKFGEIDILRSESVGPVIGGELTRQAILALSIAAVLMIIYITWRFEFFYGIAAIIALLIDTTVTLGVFSIFQIEVESAFVAAVLTVIGYSINDTIVIFDRVRENWSFRKKGVSYEKVVNASIFQTLARSINTLLAVLFILLALFFVGGETTRTFVLAMIVGTVSGGFTSIFLASSLAVDLNRTLGVKTNKKRSRV